MDQDGDGSISASELRAMIVGIRFDEIQLDRDDAVDKVMKEFDTSCDSRIDLQEFLTGISKWIHEAKRSGDDSSNNDPHTMKFLFDFHSVRLCLPKFREFIMLIYKCQKFIFSHWEF